MSENPFRAWDIVSPRPLNCLSDGQREGFKRGFGPVRVMRLSPPTRIVKLVSNL